MVAGVRGDTFLTLASMALAAYLPPEHPAGKQRNARTRRARRILQ
jgi:hypothetical protein